MSRINREQLIALLTAAAQDRKSAQIVTITARTEPKLLKGSGRGQPAANPYFGNCVKVAKVNGIINWRYTNAVNNQRAREWQPLDEQGHLEHFEAEPRAWGERQEGLPFVEHKGRLYLELKVERSLGHDYFDNDGEPLPAEQVEPWLPKRSEGKRQQVDRPVILRDYAIESITALTAGGQSYEVE